MRSYAPSMSHEVVTGSYWDSLTFDSRSHGGRHYLFQQPVSTNRTFWDTNMQVCGALPAPTSMQVRRLKFTFLNSTRMEDVYTVAESHVFSLLVMNKRQAQGIIGSLDVREGTAAAIRICEFCHSVYAASCNCPNCGAAEARISNCGEAATTGRSYLLDLLIPCSIPAQAYFVVELSQEAPLKLSAPVRMWCHLEGEVTRAIC